MKKENKKAQTVEKLQAQLTNTQQANAALKAKVAELNVKIVELAASKEVAAQA